MAAESLYSNYYAYLRDARQKIAASQLACTNWSRRYEDEEEDYEDEEGDCTDNENGNYDDEFYEDESSINSSAYNSPDKDINSTLKHSYFDFFLFLFFLFFYFSGLQQQINFCCLHYYVFF